MQSLDTIARRVADRIWTERAAGDEWRCEQICRGECLKAGLTDEALIQDVGLRAAAIFVELSRGADDADDAFGRYMEGLHG